MDYVETGWVWVSAWRQRRYRYEVRDGVSNLILYPELRDGNGAALRGNRDLDPAASSLRPIVSSA